MVTIIQAVIAQGLSQKRTCAIFGLATRKFRRWQQPQPPAKPRTAWNALRLPEQQAIIQTAWQEQFLGKPASHIFVHGHDSAQFFASLSTVYRVLHTEKLVKPKPRTKKAGSYISVHALLDEGFSLLCYDATQFVTDTGIIVWAIPVLLLPTRYLICVGHSLQSVSATDLTKTVAQAHALLPQLAQGNLVAHSDRGSPMKAAATKRFVKELLGAPIHYGRPQTPDDEAWIEALIKTFKYHREAPLSFPQVADVIQWFNRFPEIYNNEPHSSLSYVTPAQAFAGRKEAILAQRKRNLLVARTMRHAAWKLQRTKSLQVQQK